MRGGAWFTDAHQDHAITETAPGHATLLAGRFPRSTGITMNSVGVADDAAPLIAGGYGPGASPRRFNGTTLVDWLRARDARSRALSVSTKDRGAILPVGRSRSQVYWYSPDGRFTSPASTIATRCPAWVNAFNDRRMPEQLRRPGMDAAARRTAPITKRDSVTFESAVTASRFRIRCRTMRSMRRTSCAARRSSTR